MLHIYNQKLKLLEMVVPWTDIRANLRSHLDVLYEHLVKLYEMPDNEAAVQWMTSVLSGYRSIEKQKSNHQFPSYENIYAVLWTEQLDSLQVRYEAVLDYVKNSPDYPEGLKKTLVDDLEGFRSFAEPVVYYIAKSLASAGMTTGAGALAVIVKSLVRTGRLKPGATALGRQS